MTIGTGDDLHPEIKAKALAALNEGDDEGFERETLVHKIHHRAWTLLGGESSFNYEITNPLEAHDAIMRRFSGLVVYSLVNRVQHLPKSDLLTVIGISQRSTQRLLSNTKKVTYKEMRESKHSLNELQSGQAWRFAEILSLATEVFGDQEDAETWMGSPAIGLDGRRPIDLLTSPAGAEIVEQFLIRLEHGDYT